MNKQEKMVELSKKTKSKDLKNLINLIYLSNNAYCVTKDMFEWERGYPTHKTVQRLFSCPRTTAKDLVNTLEAIDLSHDTGFSLLISEEDKQKFTETLKERLQKEN